MGYGNERMPWHSRKAARAASIEWRSADYGSLALLTLLLALGAGSKLWRDLGRWTIGVRNGNPKR